MLWCKSYTQTEQRRPAEGKRKEAKLFRCVENARKYSLVRDWHLFTIYHHLPAKCILLRCVWLFFSLCNAHKINNMSVPYTHFFLAYAGIFIFWTCGPHAYVFVKSSPTTARPFMCTHERRTCREKYVWKIYVFLLLHILYVRGIS